jgi:hypothetical protein
MVYKFVFSYQTQFNLQQKIHNNFINDIKKFLISVSKLYHLF